MRTRDGGRTWSQIPAPATNAQTLRFADARDGWAGVTALYSTHDGGNTWHKQAISGPVSHIETGGGWAFATVDGCVPPTRNQCAPNTDVFASPIGRDAWRSITKHLNTDGGESGFVVHGADWYLATAGGIYHGRGTTLLGELPKPCTKAYRGSGAPGLAVADALHLDAVCAGVGGMGSADYQLYGSTDGGHTWRTAGAHHLFASGLDGVADNARGVLLIATSSAASEIVRTTNDGKSYQDDRVPAPGGGFAWSDLGFTTPTQAVAVLDRKGLYLSHDAGKTFARVRF